MNKNIILIGYRGSGKTTVGKILAEKLNLKYISTDDEIEKFADKKISEIVKENGWSYFRKLEEEIIENVCKISNAVIATGGGSILSKKNVENLKKNGIFFYLKCSADIIFERIKNSDRPSLQGNVKITIEEIEKTLKEREKIYSGLADFTIETSNLTVNGVVEKILEYIKFTNEV